MNPSTYFSLMAEFGTGHIPATEIGAKYFGYDEVTAKRKAAKNDFPFPVFRVGSNKTTWMVDIADFAAYLDSVKEKAKKEYALAK
jgi:hypothetical protein